MNLASILDFYHFRGLKSMLQASPECATLLCKALRVPLAVTRLTVYRQLRVGSSWIISEIKKHTHTQLLVYTFFHHMLSPAELQLNPLELKL